MGQQQLLLLVFGIVVVGALVVMGAYAFNQGRTSNHRAMVFQEALQVVGDLQAWKQKPVVLGGGSRARGFRNVTFKTLEYRYTLLSNRVYKTEIGCYMLRTTGDEPHVELILSAPSCAQSDFVSRVTVRGPGPGDLDWQHTPSATLSITDMMEELGIRN